VVTSNSVIERDPTILIPETQPQIPTASASNPNPIENICPTSTAVAQILELYLMSTQPLLQLIETHLPAYSVFHGNRDPVADGGEGAAAAGEREAAAEEQVQGVVGQVLHILFENPDYPKADLRAGVKRKGKRVGDPDDQDSFPMKPKIDYASIDRPFPGGPNYFDLALVCPFLTLNLLVLPPNIFPTYP
jgi:hypothetical protein